MIPVFSSRNFLTFLIQQSGLSSYNSLLASLIVAFKQARFRFVVYICNNYLVAMQLSIHLRVDINQKRY